MRFAVLIAMNKKSAACQDVPREVLYALFHNAVNYYNYCWW
jgi:hypothetical protein